MISQLKETNVTFENWDSNNSLVIAWLLNSMESEISQPYMYYQTTKEVWDCIKVVYFNLGDSSYKLEIRTQLHGLKQGDQTVT